MKKIFYLMLAVAALGFAACNEEEVQPASFEVVRTDVGFAAEGGEGTIDLVATLSNCAIQENHTVKATTNNEWITIGETTSTKVCYTVAPYTGALNRSGKIYISAGAVSQEVTIIQEATRFDIEVKSYELDPAGQVATRIEYASNSGSAPVVTIPESASWLTAQVVDGAIELMAELNYEEPRSTTATIQMDWKPIEISVSQDAVNLVTKENIIAKYFVAMEETITPTEYLPLAAPAWDVVSNNDWITVEKAADSFTVSLTENTTGQKRNGTISLTDGGSKVLRTITVQQGILPTYEWFIGSYTMATSSAASGGSAVSTTITLSQKVAGKSFTATGFYSSIAATIDFVETEDNVYLSMPAQSTGKFSGYNTYLAVLYNDSGSTMITWSNGPGYNIVYTNATTLTFEDNGVLGSPLVGFGIAALSGTSYAGNFKTFYLPTTLTRK